NSFGRSRESDTAATDPPRTRFHRTSCQSVPRLPTQKSAGFSGSKRATLSLDERLTRMPESKAAIFEQSTLGRNWPRRPTLAASIVLHLVLFLLVLRGRIPVFVAPLSVLGGAHG